MILLLNLVRPGLEMEVRVKSLFLYFSDPHLALVSDSAVVALLLIYVSSSQENEQTSGRH